MPVKFDQIGKVNQALVLAIKNGDTHAMGYPLTEYQHDTAFNYDLSFGVYGINTKKPLSGTYVGVKYYCYKSVSEIDMAKRIVHIYDRLNPGSPQTFYRLIHTPGDPGLRDNSYNQCDLITDIP